MNRASAVKIIFSLGVAAVSHLSNSGVGLAQTLPYTSFYEILPSTSSISGVQALADASGTYLSADAVVGQSLQNNFVEELPAIGNEANGIVRQSRFIQSGQSSQGIIAINQESGNLNNQSNVFVVSALAGLGDADLSEAGLVSVARSQGNSVQSAGGDREDRIQVSFFRSSGVVAMNQTAGNLNQQSNVMVLTEATAPVSDFFTTLNYSALEEVVAGNGGTIQPTESEGLRRDFMHASFVEFRGLAQINQSAGDLNVVQNGMLVSMNGLGF